MTPNLVVAENAKGRGVYAAVPFASGRVIEHAPAIVWSRAASPRVDRFLLRYLWEWHGGRLALPLGLISLCNHSSRPNAEVTHDVARRSMTMRALRRIDADEEVLLFYGEGATAFRVIEGGG